MSNEINRRTSNGNQSRCITWRQEEGESVMWAMDTISPLCPSITIDPECFREQFKTSISLYIISSIYLLIPLYLYYIFNLTYMPFPSRLQGKWTGSHNSRTGTYQISILLTISNYNLSVTSNSCYLGNGYVEVTIKNLDIVVQLASYKIYINKQLIYC